jgi:hypothetical protein
MKDKQIALSIKQMERLQKLGVDLSAATMYWKAIVTDSKGIAIPKKNIHWFLSLDTSIQTCDFMKVEVKPTFTVNDIFDILPPHIKNYSLCVYMDDKFLSYDTVDCCDRIISYKNSQFYFYDKSLLEASYDMLCWVAENGYLKQQ